MPSTDQANSAELLPVNFRLSPQAVDAIRSWLELVSSKRGGTHIPAIFWGTASRDKAAFHAGPFVGAYPEEEVDPADIVEMDGLRFVYPVLQEEHERFEGMVLDHDGQRYLLQPPAP